MFFARRGSRERVFIGRTSRMPRELAREVVSRMVQTPAGEQQLRAILSLDHPPRHVERLDVHTVVDSVVNGLTNGQYAIVSDRPSAWMSPAPVEENESATPEVVAEAEPPKEYDFLLRLLDQELRPILGVDIVFLVDGEPDARIATTDGQGIARIQGAKYSTASARIKDLAKVQKHIAASKTLAYKIPEVLPDHTHVKPLSQDMVRRETAVVVALEASVQETLVMTRPVLRARLLGAYFEANKSFPGQDMMLALANAVACYGQTPEVKLVIVAHTDHSGQDKPAVVFSLDRARAVKECFERDVQPWLDRFSTTHTGELWGASEVTQMLRATNGTSPTSEEVDETSKNTQKLKTLILAYMDLLGSHPTFEIIAYGCGDRFPVHKYEKEDPVKPDNRRVELLFFDGPICPEPPAETSAQESTEYKAWLEQVVGTINFRADSITIRVSLFFDGTGNNRVNTRHREDDGFLLWKYPLNESYYNDISNIPRLEETLAEVEGYDLSLCAYMEGIGTTDNDFDSLDDQAMGTGETGVPARVEQMFRTLRDHILGRVVQKNISCIDLDTFGFSRGAAAARYFVHVVHHGLSWNERKGALVRRLESLQGELQREDFVVTAVNVKFVGLFDTVASYGRDVAGSLLPDRWAPKTNTKDLHLDAISVAERVIHLAASEEHRENFPLTNIASAGANGLELFLPGCHSDIGGGYANADVDKCQLYDQNVFDELSNMALDLFRSKKKKERLEREAMQRIEREINWFVDMGWYLRGELTVSDDDEIIGTRQNILNTYSRIPLHLMARYAEEYGLVFALEESYPIPADDAVLQEAKEKIDEYIAEHCSGTSVPGHWFAHPDALETPEWLMKLRHGYVHLSAVYGSIGMAPNMVNNRRLRGINSG